MLKNLFKSIVFTIILIGLFSYGVYLKTGKWMGPNFANLSMPKKPKVNLPKSDSFKSKFTKKQDSLKINKNQKGDSKVYKWQDEKGVWHYQTHKPALNSSEEMK